MLLINISGNLATSSNPTMTKGSLSTVRKMDILAFPIHIFKVAIYIAYFSVKINKITSAH